MERKQYSDPSSTDDEMESVVSATSPDKLESVVPVSNTENISGCGKGEAHKNWAMGLSK